MRVDPRRLAGLDAFHRHRLRTALSAVGVTLAVAVALATAAVNEGARRAAVREVEQLGASTIVVRATGLDGHLSMRDLAAVDPSEGIAAISPALQRTDRISGPSATHVAQAIGVTAGFSSVRDLHSTRGRLLHRWDDDSRARVCVMDAVLARRLFGHGEPVGGHVRIGGEWYSIVGTVTAGEDVAFVPLSALAARSDADPDQPVSAIWLRVDGTHAVPDVAARVRAILKRSKQDARGYEVIVAQELLKTRDATRRMFGVIGAVMAALLFLLGGTAIANVMLTSVLERTPEIGLRRAVGATRRDILLQFLLEAGAIAASGSLAGLALGACLTLATARYAGWPTALSSFDALPVLATALALGICAGVYPALRASNIQPIEAIQQT